MESSNTVETSTKGRLRDEIDRGVLMLDAMQDQRFRFQFHVDGRNIGVTRVFSVGPRTIRLERAWNAFDRKIREFDGTPPEAGFSLDEWRWEKGERVPTDRVYFKAGMVSIEDGPDTQPERAKGPYRWECLILHQIEFTGGD